MPYIARTKTVDTTTASNLASQTFLSGLGKKTITGTTPTVPTATGRNLFSGAGTVWGSSAGTGKSAVIPITGNTLIVFITVSAVAGTPTGTVTVEWSNDGVNFSSTGDSYTASLTGTGTTSQSFPVKGSYARLSWSIGSWSAGKTITVAASAYQPEV